MPSVSVVIPAYDRADLIGETIDSVFGQTYRDFEVLVVDDGSTDGTADVVRRRYGSAVRCVSLAHSGLPACPRNEGVRMAAGTWVAFLDSDDLWLPDKLARQMAAVAEHPEAALVYGEAEMFDPAGPRGFTVPRGLARSGDVFEALLRFNFIPLLTVLVRRSVLLDVGLFDTRRELRAIEDYDLWLRIAARHRVCFIPEVLARYRLHPRNISGDRGALYERWATVLRKTFGAETVRPSVRWKAWANLRWLEVRYRLSL